LSSETSSPFGYNDNQTKVMKGAPSSFARIIIHRDDKYYPFIYRFISLVHDKHMECYIDTFSLFEVVDARAITIQCEQYGVTVHLFIGTGHSPGKIQL
jgi:hypothetical protein